MNSIVRVRQRRTDVSTVIFEMFTKITQQQQIIIFATTLMDNDHVLFLSLSWRATHSNHPQATQNTELCPAKSKPASPGFYPFLFCSFLRPL
jgi:hypothetical protein